MRALLHGLRIALLGAGLLLGGVAHGAFDGRVVGVQDGDSLTIVVAEREVRVRLANIDAPEMGQPFGKNAKEALAALAFGKTVHVIGVGQDNFGRVLGRVYVDGREVNGELLRTGNAWVFRRFSSDPRLLSLEDEARKLKRGLWQDEAPVPPWEWRDVHPDGPEAKGPARKPPMQARPPSYAR